MGRQTYLSITAMLVLMLLLSGSVSAFILDQHVRINSEAIARTPNSPITQEVIQYEDYFHACNMGTDISVVSYLTIDEDEEDDFIDKLLNIFSFRIGKSYRSTHSTSACSLALDEATNAKERVCGYAICAHHLQDSTSHNLAVPLAIEKTNLFNGMVHSIKEIHDKNLMTSHEDFVRSRQSLDLLYEMTPYFERVLVQDPVLSDVEIPEMIDFFVAQVQPEGEYRLGFRAFFALPKYIYWLVLVAILLAFALLALTIRKVFIDHEANTLSVFTFGFSTLLFTFFGTVVYGLFTGNIWLIWERLSQFIFSPSMYIIGGGAFIVAGVVLFRWMVGNERLKNLPNLFVGLFLVLFAVAALYLPSGLVTGNEQAVHDLAVQRTVDLLNNGKNIVFTVPDPVGFEALKAADASGQGVRSFFLGSMIVLLILIIYATFRRRK